MIYKSIEFRNGEYFIKLVQGPDWKEVTIKVDEYWPSHGEEVEFILEHFDELACGVSFDNLHYLANVFKKLIYALTETYALKG